VHLKVFASEDFGQSAYFDPWKLPPGSPVADVILVSHDHYDHLSVDDVARVSGPGNPFHPRQAEHNGYIVTVGGERLYHAGDTDHTLKWPD